VVARLKNDTTFTILKFHTMRKYRTIIAVIIMTAISGTGCQALSTGIAKKSSCCEKLISTCTGNKVANDATDAEENSATTNTTGSADDILHNLPFSTIAQ